MKKNSPIALRRSSWLNPIIALAIALALIGPLFNGCGGDPPPKQEGGGEEVPVPDTRPDPKVSSPITIIPPLLNCGESVTVRGFVSQAKIRIYVNGSERGSDIGQRSPTVKSSGVVNDLVFAAAS